jgi:short subunit dehydrogenase-like uncharacterized protein
MNAPRTTPGRTHDVVLYGATGFVGRQTVRYFAEHAGGLRWALGGRSAPKLAQVRKACGPGAAEAGIVVAASDDTAALDALAAQTAVVLSTAGPFALHGSALVAACVKHGTHYVDITGETPWVRDLIDRHHRAAVENGVRIIPCCGFDSVPSDLGAWLVARAVHEVYGEPCVSVKACHSMRGGVNGGTLASALNMLDSGQARRIDDPFLLNPPGSVPARAAEHADPLAPHLDSDFDAWVGPFVMGPVNTRVVRRSVALLAAGGNPAYGADFHYQEYQHFGPGPLAAAAAGGVSLGMSLGRAAMQLEVVRTMLKSVVPAPGSGPSEYTMDHGSFRCDLVGRSTSGHLLRGRIAGDGDPGNRATTQFVCEAALALALEPQALPGGSKGGGVLTPATGLGAALARRLVAAGTSVEPSPP